MAKICLVIFVVFSIISTVVLSYKIEKSVHPDHPHQCWDQEADAFYQHGSYNQRPGKCEMIRCYADSSMEAVGCHTKTLQSGCSASPTDFKKSYPDCCPRITCQPPPQPTHNNDNHYGNHNFYNNNHNFNHNGNNNGNQKVGKQAQSTNTQGQIRQNTVPGRVNTNSSQSVQSSGTIGVKG